MSERHPGDADDLRRRADEIIGGKAGRKAEDHTELAGLKLLLHELKVHQIELELQNEELRQAQVELNTARMRYFDLYDLAPVGYITVSAQGLMARSVFAEIVADPTARAKIDFTAGELPDAEGDAALVRQVWVNLLSNAVKYSSCKERSVIEITGALEGNQFVYRVRDNGAGFDMQYAGKLFGVFQRLHTPERFEGTGIGLALVQRIDSAAVASAASATGG